MTIYTPIAPTYLYIKQHSVTGLKYFGKTTKKDPYKYPGSGKHWTNHIKVHGREHIITLWVSDLYYDKSIVDYALHFSEENNIVKSTDWANLKPENGLDGGALSEETRAKISAARKGKKLSEETKAKISASGKGIKKKHFSKEIKVNNVKPSNKQIKARKAFANNIIQLQLDKKERKRELNLCYNDDYKFLVNRYYDYKLLPKPKKHNLQIMRQLLDKKLYNL
jgi:hypothetical protein